MLYKIWILIIMVVVICMSGCSDSQVKKTEMLEKISLSETDIEVDEEENKSVVREVELLTEIKTCLENGKSARSLNFNEEDMKIVNSFFQRKQIVMWIDINFTILHICILPFLLLFNCIQLYKYCQSNYGKRAVFLFYRPFVHRIVRIFLRNQSF